MLEDLFQDDCRRILLKVVSQAVHDYLSGELGDTYIELEHFITAKEFLFNLEYKIQWGDLELGLADICDILGLEVAWIHRKLASVTQPKEL